MITKGGRSVDADFLLIQRMRLGDERAVEQFVRKYYPAILRYCRLRAGDAGYGEDLAQETFERFFRTLEQYRHSGRALNYLYVIAGNACRDFQRRRRERCVEAVEERAEADAPPEDRLVIEAAFRALPEELFEVATLYFLQERKQREIAQILGIGVPLVKYRVRRAREILQRKLEEA